MRAIRHDLFHLIRLASSACLILFFSAIGFAGEKNYPSDVALVGAKVYVSPAAAPIEDAVVLVRDGKVVEIGKRGSVTQPKSAQVIDCTGKVSDALCEAAPPSLQETKASCVPATVA